MTLFEAGFILGGVVGAVAGATLGHTAMGGWGALAGALLGLVIGAFVLPLMIFAGFVIGIAFQDGPRSAWMFLRDRGHRAREDASSRVAPEAPPNSSVNAAADASPSRDRAES